MNVIYADNNATTRVAPEVVEAMEPFFTECYFNPSSMYEPARGASDAIAQSRRTIMTVLGAADENEILFTGCATESNNHAIFGTLRALAMSDPQRREVITTAVEHPAVLEVCNQLERDGYTVHRIGVDTHGNLDIRAFVRALRPGHTAIVSIMHANNETGVLFPVEHLSTLTKETDPSILFHTDATQSVGKQPIDLSGNFAHVDLLSMSGHKIHAPKGIGLLYIRRGTPIRSFLIGGHQESGRRGGTENVAYIVGLAKAMELVSASSDVDEARIRELRNRFEEGLRRLIPAIRVNGEGAPRLPGTTNVSCWSIEGESILMSLNLEHICASSGSACTSGSLEPSHVLRAMHVPLGAIGGSIRFSFSRYTTDEEIDRILAVFPEIVSNLREKSPFWDVVTQSPTGIES
ncbi:MAG: aminotransferase class V-fold PLP-dependent enzyme [Planctomycetia bacterium]|nr:aminotransferase class V-fold PLP-dependent enzyme [Planctomycetia bacterium]